MPARAALLAALLLMGRVASAAADTVLELAVTINGAPTGKIGEFVQRGDVLLVRPAEWAALGLRLPAPTPAGPDGLVPLPEIARLQWRFDAESQTLALTAPDALLIPSLLQQAPPPDAAAPIESGLGVTLNYDLTASYAGGAAAGNGLFDLRGFSPWGILSTSVLGYAGTLPASGSSLVRLDSGFAYADTASLRRYRLGDVIGGGLAWTRPVRLGGVQIQSDFSMRPDLVTFPVPAVSGSAAVPSTVDVLVNNSQLLSQQVAPGPFAVSQLPVVSGAGTVTTTVTNALGQQTTTTLPFYASNQLLAPGLQSYSAEAGWVRQNWGLLSDDYRKPAGALTYRRGLTDILTGEFHAEGTAGQAMAGIGLVANAFDFGTLDIALAQSLSGARRGGQLSFGFHRLARVFGFGVSAILADKDFRDLAAMNGTPAPQLQITANTSLSLGKWGAFGLAYTGMRRDIDETAATGGTGILPTGGYAWRGTTPDTITLPPAARAHLLSASYSLQWGKVALYATGFHDFAGSGGGALLGLTVPLGPRSSASASAGTGSGGAYGQVQAVQSAVETGDWGYQLYATSDTDHEFAEAQYKARWGLVSGGVDRLAGLTTARAEAAGAIAAIKDGGVFASNPIDDSFAVADTGGLPGIAVMEENRLVGRTDADGRILVPDLRAFDANHISIDPDDVPASYVVDADARTVRPQDRSGVVVRFPIRRSNAALLKLTDAAGRPLPLGSTATPEGGAPLPMGYDGEVYVENLQAKDNRLTVTRPDGGRCTVTFDAAPSPDAIPTIGPLVCAGQP